MVSGSTRSAGLEHLHQAGLDDRPGLERILERVEELVHVDPVMAGTVGDLVSHLAAGQQLADVGARADYCRARVRAERGELSEALELIAAARTRWMISDNPLQALRTDLGRMQILDDLGRHEEAASTGRRLLVLLDEFDREQDQATLVATIRAGAWGNVGVAYSFTGEHDRSLEAYARSEAAFQELGMDVHVAQQQANRGIELLALGRPRQACQSLHLARESFAAAGDRLWSAKCAANLADALQQLGDLVEALRVLHEARTELAALGASAEEARVLLQIARTYLAAGLFAESASSSAEAARRATASGMLHDAAFARLTLALAHLGSHDLGGAAEQVTRATELFEQVGDRQYLARIRLTQAEVASKGHKAPEATAYLESAVDALRKGGWMIPLAWAKLLQVDYADGWSEREARTNAAQDVVSPLEVPALQQAFDLRLARVRRHQGRTGEARTLLRRTVAAHDLAGSHLPDPMMRTAFRADKVAAHDELVDVLVTSGSPEDLAEATLVSDAAKAATLKGLVSAARTRRSIDRSNAALAPTVEQLMERRVDLSASFTALQNVQDPSRRALIRREAARLETEISELQVRLAVSRSGGVQGDITAPGSPSTAPATRPTLAYHVLDEDIIAFVTLGSHSRVRRLRAAVAPVGRALEELDCQWNRFRLGSAFVERHAGRLQLTTERILQNLYDLLVAPVRDELDETGADELVVVPHRLLHRVPFHALHDETGPLFQRWTFTQAPTLLRAWSRTEAAHPAGSDMLALAVPDERSPLIEHEASALRRMFPGAHVLTGDEATSAALAARLPGPAYVHLACHGIFRSANPMFSAVRLADRWLTAADVLELDLGGALVTLSACESGRPAIDAAEAVGLSWAFLAAGASGVVLSQWLVDDAVAVELMSLMYEQLVAGRPPAAALNAAMADVSEQHPHTYYWAPFVYVESLVRESP